MIKKGISRRAAELSVLFGLVCAVFVSAAHFDAACDDLRNNVLRLHIIANSDSKEDQAVKLAVRDVLLDEASELFEGQTELEAAERTAEANTELFAGIAERVLKENGFLYGAEVSVGISTFSDFSLLAI